MEKDAIRIFKIVGLLALSILLVISFFGSFSVIKPGNVGVVFNSITGTLRTSGQGIVFKVPFVTDVQSYPVSLRTYTMVRNTKEGKKEGDDSIDLPTKEGQHIFQDISVTFNTSEKMASDVFKAFKGADLEIIEDSFIRRTIISTAQDAAGVMSLTGIISKERDTLKKNIEDSLRRDLAKMGFILDRVNLGASHLPDALEKQLQANMNAELEAAKAGFEQKRQENLAKAKIAEAEGVREANNKIQSSLTPLILEKMKIEKWDGKLPQVMGGSTPMIQMK